MSENLERRKILPLFFRSDRTDSMTVRSALVAFISFGATLALSTGGVFFLSPKSAEAKTFRNVFIHAVQTAGTTTSEDFIEIQNDEECALDLSDWKLRKRTASGSESSIKAFGDTSILPPGETLLWANSTNGFADALRATEKSTATLTDNNSLALIDVDDTIVDSISWGTVNKPFRSDEPNVRNPKANEMIIRSSKSDMPTIETTILPTGHTFDRASLDFCGVSKDRAGSAIVVLSEILANPTGDESTREFIEIENRSKNQFDLSGWKLRDASKTGKYIFPSESSIAPNTFLTIFRSDFIFALNNSAETVSLEDSTGATADSVSWEKTRENVSLARDESRWRNTKFLTPGEANRFGNDPSAKTSVPKTGFAKISIPFSASIKDKDRDKTKVVWDFGDGHKSYKKDTAHTFAKTGRYTVKLTYTDGISDKTKTFRIKIEKYVAPKVRIVSLVPNPQGADTGREYLLIQNKSKKEVDLKGWSIATKSKFTTKNFVNHKITESVTIKPGTSVRITREHAAFTLGNTRQYLELRDPQGKAVQRIHYKLDKSAPDDAEFFKIPDHSWEWRLPAPLDAATSVQ
ncbi:MAG: lamin tail domain-containing protein [Candidatus Moraniibacteriota bacterium]|nr:MAG: lamin tail domain-containing protein [Candidatus Moranbacteria bacterium]